MITLTKNLNFAALRIRAGFKSQRHLASVLRDEFGLSISFQTISGWETGKWKPELSPGDTKILLKVLRCSLDELVDAFESPSSETVDDPD